MARRIFMSYQHRDHGRARGFNLMRQSPKVKAEFSVRHLLTPVKSTNPGYIGTKIREQLDNTSVTAVLIGKDTANSDWVAKEIAWSLEKGNGLVGILIDPSAAIPEALRAYGAEIVDWSESQTSRPSRTPSSAPHCGQDGARRSRPRSVPVERAFDERTLARDRRCAVARAEVLGPLREL